MKKVVKKVDEEEMDIDLDMGDEETDVDMDVEGGEEEVEMEGFMKPIQKLTGKLGQKLRDAEEEMGSADIKYVLNSIISAVDLENLEEDDKDDVLDRFEEDESAYGDEEEEMDIDMGDDFEEEGEEGEEMEFEDEGEVEDEEVLAMESLRNRVSHLLESYTKEATPKVKIKPADYINKRLGKINHQNRIKELSSTIEQEISATKFIKENKNFNLNGTTKRGSLVFISEDDKMLVRKDGIVK